VFVLETAQCSEGRTLRLLYLTVSDSSLAASNSLLPGFEINRLRFSDYQAIFFLYSQEMRKKKSEKNKNTA